MTPFSYWSQPGPPPTTVPSGRTHGSFLFGQLPWPPALFCYNKLTCLEVQSLLHLAKLTSFVCQQLNPHFKLLQFSVMFSRCCVVASDSLRFNCTQTVRRRLSFMNSCLDTGTLRLTAETGECVDDSASVVTRSASLASDHNRFLFNIESR